MANTAAQTYVGTTGITGPSAPLGIATVASASAIAITSGYTHLITGSTSISTMTGGSTGNIVTLVASGQATGICVVLNHGTGSNNLYMRDSVNFGIYVGESVTFQYDGTKWIEINRNVRTVLNSTQITSSVSITATTEATATTVVTNTAFTFDGTTPIEIRFYTPVFQSGGVTNMYLTLYDGSSSIGLMGGSSIQTYGYPVTASRSLTPTNASHTYSIRSFRSAVNSTIVAGVAGSAAYVPAYSVIRRAA